MTGIHLIYGLPPHGIVSLPDGAIQCSPLIPGAQSLLRFAPGSAASAVVLAPPGTIERRRVIALVLKTLADGAPLTVLAPNDKGGTRLAAELEAFGCTAGTASKRHHRIADCTRPSTPVGLDEAIAAGDPQLVPAIGLWSQPGLFNWDSIDPGSQLLLDHLPALSGRGADLGCGIGVLGRAIMADGACSALTLIDVDARALAVAEANVPGKTVSRLWADVRSARDLPIGLDFVVTNPPFHDGGAEDRLLGQTFIEKAAGMLRPGGELWLVANRHLPYEATLTPLFAEIEPVAQARGFKVYRAAKAAAAPVARTRRAPR